MTAPLVLTRARLVLADEVVCGSLLIEDGRIRSIDQGHTSIPGAIDCEGDYLMPGFVEIHTDNFERHRMPRPQVFWATLPALIAHDAEVAAAGITTVFDALGVGDADGESLRGSSWQEVVDALDHCQRDQLLRCDHYLHARCELPAPNTIELFAPFHNHPRLALISLMDHTPGQRQWENIEHASIYYIGKKGWSEEKFRAQVGRLLELQTRYSAPHRDYFVAYCREHGIALASHDDTTAAHVRQAHADGARISEFPTTVEAASTACDLGLSTVAGGPNVVRGGSHSGNVAAAELARMGLLDVLSSDYVPGSLLDAVLRLADAGLLSLPAAVACVSRNAALACGLTDRGQLAQGLRGDIVRVRTLAGMNGRSMGVVRSVWRAGSQVL